MSLSGLRTRNYCYIFLLELWSTIALRKYSRKSCYSRNCLEHFFDHLHGRIHLVSLRSKCFRGVFYVEKPISVFLDAREMGREQTNGGEGGIENLYLHYFVEDSRQLSCESLGCYSDFLWQVCNVDKWLTDIDSIHTNQNSAFVGEHVVQNRGGCRQAFPSSPLLSSPPPPPSSVFLLSPHFARVQKYWILVFSAENSMETLASQAITL